MGFIFSLIVIIFLLVVVFRQRRQIKELSQLERGNAHSSGGSMLVDDEAPIDTGAVALFATLSHELRTPLNGLLGIVQMMNEEKQDEDLLAIEGCARHMLAVMSTLVNHSKIKAEWSDLPEYREWVSPYELLEQIAKHLKFRAGLRGLKLELVHQDKTLRLRVDYDHLRSIIENAILGSLEAISLVEIPGQQKTLTVQWEADDGEVRVTIHNPLETYGDDRRHQVSTAGGLTTGEQVPRLKMEYVYWSVASLLLEKYNGALFSKPNSELGGVTSLLSFEMEQMQASPTEKLPIGGLSFEGKPASAKFFKELPFKLSILVAEDDPVARSLMATVLKHMGQESHFATNGREILDLVSQSKSYDVILMDIDMPIMDGLSASIALRNGEAGEFGTKIPIVAVTAFNTLSDESRFRKAGMDYFLPKPITLKDLRNILLEVVRSN